MNEEKKIVYVALENLNINETYRAYNHKDNESRAVQSMKEALQRDSKLINPIIVTKADEEGKYDIVDGNIRYLAAKALMGSRIALNSIPCLVIEKDVAAQFAVKANILHSAVNAVSKARALAELKKACGYTQDKELVVATGYKKNTISLYNKVLSLPEEALQEAERYACISVNGLAKIARKNESVEKKIEEVKNLCAEQKEKNHRADINDGLEPGEKRKRSKYTSESQRNSFVTHLNNVKKYLENTNISIDKYSSIDWVGDEAKNECDAIYNKILEVMEMIEKNVDVIANDDVLAREIQKKANDKKKLMDDNAAKKAERMAKVSKFKGKPSKDNAMLPMVPEDKKNNAA